MTLGWMNEEVEINKVDCKIEKIRQIFEFNVEARKVKYWNQYEIYK